MSPAGGGLLADRADLFVDLERPLPGPLPPGRATAVFVLGTCWHRLEAVEGLAVLVDGVRHPVAAFARRRSGLPAPVAGDPAGHRERSGFWATVPIPAQPRPGTVALEVAVRLVGGRELVAPLGGLDVAEPAPLPRLEPRPAAPGPGLIAVCMATFEPDPALFRAQIDSLRAQTDQRWVCVLSDDGSRPEHVAVIEEILGGDPRFALSRSGERLGFYRNFERALRLAPPEAEYLALSDQDDRWHPDKLATLRGALGDGSLVFSDQRLVDADGRVLRDTLWQGRRNNHSNLASLVVANTITGAAMLLPRAVAELAVPFPDTPGFQFHDHWLGLVGLAAGEVRYVDRPLYDYVQHAGAIFGDVTRGPGRVRRRRPELAALRQTVRDPLVTWRAAYFYGYLAREVQVQAVLARCADRLTPAKRRTLERFVAAGRSPLALAWLAARPARELVGRNETLATELALARGILWFRIAPAFDRLGPLRARAVGTADFPAPGSFNQKRMRRWRARV